MCFGGQNQPVALQIYGWGHRVRQLQQAGSAPDEEFLTFDELSPLRLWPRRELHPFPDNPVLMAFDEAVNVS